MFITSINDNSKLPKHTIKKTHHHKNIELKNSNLQEQTTQAKSQVESLNSSYTPKNVSSSNFFSGLFGGYRSTKRNKKCIRKGKCFTMRSKRANRTYKVSKKYSKSR